MKPIGKSYGGFDLYPVMPKRYRCDRCGYVTTQSTNHYQKTYSFGHDGVCPECPPWAKYPEFGGQTTWTCIDSPEDDSQQTRVESVLKEADMLLPDAPQRSTLVIHMDDRSTDFLKTIYEGKGYDVINSKIEPEVLFKKIKACRRIFMLGHGGPSGLFGPGFVIGDHFGPELSKKEGLYIWCHAVEYAHRHKLTGLVSGMFISEVGEASWEGIKATQEEIDASNNAFSAAVRQYLDTGSSPHAVVNCYNSATCRVTQYNNARLYVMQRGRVIDSLGKEQPDEVSAKPGSPRYWELQRKQSQTTKQQGAYGDLDEPPDEFKQTYGWDGPLGENQEIEDFEFKDVEPEPVELPHDHMQCHSTCELCGEAPCTLIHRRSDEGKDRSWSSVKHLCQKCDVENFNALLDRI